MTDNLKNKIPTTELCDQGTRYTKNIMDSKNTQVKIAPNEEEKVAERSLSPYFHNSKGQLMFSEGESEAMVSATYIKLKGFIRDEEGTNWEVQIEFNDLDGNLKTIAIPRENLMEPKQITQILASEGYPSFCSKALHHYLKTEMPRERLVRAHQNGWISDSLDYIGKSFQIVNSSVKYIAPSTDQIASKGTLEEWKENICRYCENNHILTLALSASISGILLKFQDFINSTMVNLTGKSSIGKTTALQVAASIWGDSNFINQWRTTSNARISCS